VLAVKAAYLARAVLGKKTKLEDHMKRLIGVLVGAVALLVSAGTVRGQDVFVPAGTLLHCSLDEPNFSSATAAIGDPVLCHLRTQQEFGKPMFPRGSMLGGHLEADKEPGHFVGKGYLRITFDRIILPTGDLPVPAKVIQARGYKVDKQGDIDGKGHPKRDVVEWMIPPLWPWKVVSLPFRGPRPVLKGEEPLELRLMDDMVIPHMMASNPNRPPVASSRPANYSATPQANPMQQTAVRSITTTTNVSVSSVPMDSSNVNVRASQSVDSNQGVTNLTSDRFTILVLKSNQIVEVKKYHRDSDLLMYQDTQGRTGSVGMEEVDWRKTSEMTATVRSIDPGPISRLSN
jgi:hypothetical protein